MADRGDIRWEDDSQLVKVCITCSATLPKASFYKSKKNADGLEGCCKDCRSARSKAHYADNKESYKERNQKWTTDNLLRKRELNNRWKASNLDLANLSTDRWRASQRGAEGSYSLEEWLAVLERAEGKCLKCGSTDNVGRDHVVPLSRGGRNSIDNIQPLCLDCNRKKGVGCDDYR